jgi:hypothetical protein
MTPDQVITVEVLRSTDRIDGHVVYNFRIVERIKTVGDRTASKFYGAGFKNSCGNTDIKFLEIEPVLEEFVKAHFKEASE